MAHFSSILIFFSLVVNFVMCNGSSPILIVPGLISSQLEAKVSDHGLLCDTFWTYKHYWFNLLRTPSCVSSVLGLEYDPDTNEYSNADGVRIQVPGFGDTGSVEFLDEFGIIPTFHELVEYFVDKGYVRGESIRAAPYDWRLAADALEQSRYYIEMEQLIETMYRENDNQRVTIVAHSMGGPVSLYFLNNIVNQAWKHRYINAFVPISGAWSGSNMVLPIIVSGLDSLFPAGIPIVSDYLLHLAPAFQSFQSMFWLLPNPAVSKDNVLLTTDTDEYTANDYEQIFNLMGRPDHYIKHQHAVTINGNLTAPNVPVYCLYGINVPTAESFHYGSGFPHDIEQIVMGNGDGQVNVVSSEVCLKWEENQSDFFSETYSNVKHIAIISNQEVLSDIAHIAGI